MKKANQISPQVMARIRAAQKCRWAKIKSAEHWCGTTVDLNENDNMSTKKIEVEVLPKRSHEAVLEPSKAKVPTLKHGNGAKRAKELNKLIKDAEAGLVRILKVGFFLECLADDLPHGMIGPWVEANCNRSWRTVRRWKQVAAGVGDALGISLKQRLECKLHEVLALPLKKVPADLLAVREKLDAEIAGKSYRQLFLELKQVDEEDPTKPKRGRLKGQGGASMAQRAAAQQAEEEGRILELTENIKTSNLFELEIADAKGLGTQSDQVLKDFILARETSLAFARRVLASRTLQPASGEPAAVANRQS